MRDEFRKKIIPVRYYNVMFYLFLETEDAQQRFYYLHERMKSGDVREMRHIFDWCKMHKVPLATEYHYRKDYPLLANIWNGLCYFRMKQDYDTIKMVPNRYINKESQQ